MLHDWSVQDQGHRYIVRHAIVTLKIIADELLDRDPERASALDVEAASLETLLHAEPQWPGVVPTTLAHDLAYGQNGHA